MNQLASPERYLHRIAEKSVKAILAKAEVDASLPVPALECLLSPPSGHINFDHLTKTKTVEKLIAAVRDTFLADLVPIFRRLISQPGTQDSQTASVRRQILADQLVNLVRSRQFTGGSPSSEASENLQFVLSIFASFAYFLRRSDDDDSLPAQDPPFSPASREVFKSRISSCLTHLISKSSSPALFAYSVVARIREREEVHEFSCPLLSEDYTGHESVRNAWKVLEKINRKEGSDSAKRPLLSAFKLLYSLTILQVYNFEADAVGMLDELRHCYGTLIKHRKKGAQGGSDALVEIILGFVSKPSLLFRHLGRQVFSAFVSDVGEAGLQSMTQVCDIFL